MGFVTLSGLSVYPVKSARGVSLGGATVGPRGLDGDRRWIVVDEHRVFVSQRSHPRLALTSVVVRGSQLMLVAPAMPPITVDPPPNSVAAAHVRVWDDVCDAVPAGPEAAR